MADPILFKSVPNGSGSGDYYYTPKADGGYDFTRVFHDGTTSSVSQADLESATGTYFSPSNSSLAPNIPRDSEGLAQTVGSGDGPTALEREQERALYDDQIGGINSLLGLVGSQRTSGQNSLANSRNTVMTGYADQDLQNTKDRQSGVENVDRYAGNNLTQLRTMLQGGNAGNSSVGRELIPYLIAKSAGARRTGVINTAGENERNIATARAGADTEFKEKEKSFLEALLMKELELTNQKSSLETQKSIASGAGYGAAQSAAAASRNAATSKSNEIKALLGQYTPTTTTPELSKYQVDPAKLAVQGQGPSESSYYMSQWRKKQNQQI